MVYVVFVNPQILGCAGIDRETVLVANCIAAASSTLVMALDAGARNYPSAFLIARKSRQANRFCSGSRNR